ncbi:unnamed protein product, partial [Laminaria digitata]
TTTTTTTTTNLNTLFPHGLAPDASGGQRLLRLGHPAVPCVLEQHSRPAPRLEQDRVLNKRPATEHFDGHIFPCFLAGDVVVRHLLKHHCGHFAVVLVHESRDLIALRAFV